ncbi:MAG TPA: ferritin-like domain-containing protein [Terriglobales bacterium]
MKSISKSFKTPVDRRAFVKKSLVAGGALGAGAALLGSIPSAFADVLDSSAGPLPKGDIAILRFLAAAEILETDLWQQYNELGGVQDSEVSGGSGNEAYTEAIESIDDDMPQYIHDNTDDEISHFEFINAYLELRGAPPVNLDKFRTLPSSQAQGAQQIGRLTNLMQLTVDTSWYTKYRSDKHNPDLDPGFKFDFAVPSLSNGQFPAIPRNDDDTANETHIQAIANTAAFHFAFIEQGGTSLYPALAQRVCSVEVLRILLSIGPTETAHFMIWHDQVGNAPPLTDPLNPNLVFPDLNAPPFGGEEFSTSLVMPEPCPFLSRKLPPCSIVRPTNTKGAAMGAVKALTDDGLFIGQSPEFFQLLKHLAQQADAAQRT